MEDTQDTTKSESESFLLSPHPLDSYSVAGKANRMVLLDDYDYKQQKRLMSYFFLLSGDTVLSNFFAFSLLLIPCFAEREREIDWGFSPQSNSLSGKIVNMQWHPFYGSRFRWHMVCFQWTCGSLISTKIVFLSRAIR